MKRLLIPLLLSLMLPLSARAADTPPVDVVASFSVLADMVRQVGGEHVDVMALVGRNSDMHAYSPTPAAAEALTAADLVVVNGLGFEGWLDRLIQASGYGGPVLVASRGVDRIPAPAGGHGHRQEHGDGHEHQHSHEHGHQHEHEPHSEAHHEAHPSHGNHHEQGEGQAHEHAHGPQQSHRTDPHHDDPHGHHHHGAYDPHAWHDASRGAVYVRNIANALAEVDPAHAETYHARAEAFTARLTALHSKIKAMVAALPQDQRTVVVPHNAFRYFTDAYGIHFLAPMGLSTEAAVGAGEMAALIRQMREQDIDALFLENIADPRLIRQIARETGAKIGGTLYSDALSRADGPAGAYIEMLRYNATQITNALRGDGSASVTGANSIRSG